MPGKVVIAFLLWGALWPAFGFSLLGPYAPWMAVSNGYAQPGDLGGPMRLGQEYRWNLPGITYGFHPRFERHFGSNGVRAVQAAIRMLNQVPPASQIQLEDFPVRTTLINQDAQVLELLDLKSFVLSQLLYQLGLGPATRHVCVIRDTDLLRVILQRNYDPVTLAPTNVVNGIEYLCHLSEISPGVGDAVEEPVDELAIFAFTAVTDNQLGPGRFYKGLTRDDVGGITFLYSGANVNVERLPGSVTEAGSSIPPRVNVAPIEKLTFSKMTWDTAQHRFKPVTQRFTLKYVDRGMIKQQNVQRVVRRPDIVFDAQPLEPVQITSGTNVYYLSKMAEATTAERWVNLGYLNGNSNAAGPGVITPAAMITITFDSSSALPNPFTRQRWGSFDESSNEPILFPPIYAEP